MPDDENTPKNPTPEENSIPVSPPSFDHTGPAGKPHTRSTYSFQALLVSPNAT